MLPAAEGMKTLNHLRHPSDQMHSENASIEEPLTVEELWISNLHGSAAATATTNNSTDAFIIHDSCIRLISPKKGDHHIPQEMQSV